MLHENAVCDHDTQIVWVYIRVQLAWDMLRCCEQEHGMSLSLTDDLCFKQNTTFQQLHMHNVVDAMCMWLHVCVERVSIFGFGEQTSQNKRLPLIRIRNWIIDGRPNFMSKNRAEIQ